MITSITTQPSDDKYVYAQGFADEPRRLGLLSRILDPWTRFRLSEATLPPDARCLEVGAGLGTISEWLAISRIPAGHVVASDRVIDFMSSRTWRTDNVEVRSIDVVEDDLEVGVYDLVVTRMLLSHLPSRRQVLAKLFEAVKPGGMIYVEEADLFPADSLSDPDSARFLAEFIEFRAATGGDMATGRKVAPWLDELGAVDIDAHAHVPFARGGGEFAEFWKLSIAAARDRIRREGSISEASLAAFARLCDDPERWTMSMAFMSTIARKS